ncbi:hypothetical protein [Paracoccus aminovorans]|uniref:hypothetical protein n=1 Tax=Paracoccus aminovorans TaxID=34004 RepID=UPI0011135DE4|nr:hypothetical protein [Paracoccus aminovorans]
MTCARPGCDQTFLEGAGRKYCCEACWEKVRTKARNAEVAKLQKRLTEHLFSIRHDGEAATRFIEKLIISNDPKVKRMFGADYLYMPRRNVQGVRTDRKDLTRSQKIRYNKILR